MAPGDVPALVAAAGELVIRPRGDRWAHLSLCVLDAVFSINARYGGVVRVCHRYADHAGLTVRVLPIADVGRVVGTVREEAVGAFAELGRQLGAERLAGQVLGNRGRTSTRGGILKAQAAISYAEILSGGGSAWLRWRSCWPIRMFWPRSRAHCGRCPATAAVPACPTCGCWPAMTSKSSPTAWCCAGCANHLGRDVGVPESRTLLPQVAGQLGYTPWELDHAIWRHQSGRS